MPEVTFTTQPGNRNITGRPEILISSKGFSKIPLSKDEAVIVTDKEGAVIFMNALAEQLTGCGLPESKGKLIDDIFDAINDSSDFPVENPISKVLKENKIILLANHTVLIKKDKTQRVIVDSALPIHDDSSCIIGAALIFRDVTDQVDNRKKLLESEGLLKGIMDNTSLVIYVKDLEGNYMLINRQKEKVYNIKASELIGKSSVKHFTEEHTTESRKSDIEAISKNCLIEYEQVIQHSDGTYHTYHTSKFPLYDSENKIYAVCAMSTDISESKKIIEMKERLAMHEIVLRSEIRYDELTKNMPNMFFSLDHSYRYTSFNKACEKFTGKKAEQVIGHSMLEIFPGGTPLFMTEYKEVMESGKGKNFISTFTIDENTFTYIVNIYPAENGISVLMTDLTKQKKSEMEMLELVDRLQMKNKDLRQFAYTVSHDLRAPIARVLGLVALSGSSPDYKINDKSILENVANEITNLDNVVKDMNEVISLRDVGKQKEYVAFETELNLILKILEKEIIESHVVITAVFQKPEGILTVKGYLYSILFNLLSNAIKYRAPEVPLTIHLQTQQDSEFVCLSVEDNGRGIDMKKNGDRVFGLYNRFHGNKIEGKGIGLNLVKTQAESLGGKVEVESEVNRGSTFKIYFPKNQNQDEADQ